MNRATNIGWASQWRVLIEPKHQLKADRTWIDSHTTAAWLRRRTWTAVVSCRLTYLLTYLLDTCCCLLKRRPNLIRLRVRIIRTAWTEVCVTSYPPSTNECVCKSNRTLLIILIDWHKLTDDVIWVWWGCDGDVMGCDGDVMGMWWGCDGDVMGMWWGCDVDVMVMW